MKTSICSGAEGEVVVCKREKEGGRWAKGATAGARVF
jgi:hypothetical protein